MAVNFESLVGIITIVFGMVAVFITIFSKKRMSNPGLLRYMNYTMLAMLSLVLFSISHTIREVFELKEIYGPIAEMPEYLFVSITYILFLLGALAIFNMSKEYGFKERGKKIAQEIVKHRGGKKQ